MKKVFIITPLVTFLMVVNCQILAAQNKTSETGDAANILLTANQSYKDGDYNKAAAHYEKLLALGMVNGDIFYNLANAYFKAGKIGKALVNFRKAELFLPRDGDLQANIRYTLQLTTDKIEDREPFSFLRSFCFWYFKLTVKELVMLFLVVNFLLWGSAILMIFYKREPLAFTLYILIFFALLLGISSAIKLYSFYYHHSGVVVAKEITVRSGSSVNDTTLFKLHEGAEFSWEEEPEGWVKIRLRDGKKGWVQKETVEKVECSDNF